jgi:hypothetical protein
MGNVAIATPKLSDAATLAAGSAAAAMPVTNLQTQQPIERWRATDLANAWLEADLGQSVDWNLVWLGYNNASSAAQWRIRADSTATDARGSTPAYDSGFVDMWPMPGLDDWEWTHAFHWLASTVKSYRFLRIDISDSANAAGYFQAGRLYIARAWQPSRNLGYGWAPQFIDFSARTRAAGGQILPGSKPLHRLLSFQLKYANEDDIATAFDLDRTRGTSGDVLIMRDPDTASRLMRESVYGSFSSLEPLTNSQFNLYQKPYEIEEMTP